MRFRRSLLRALQENDQKIEERNRALLAAQFDMIAEPTTVRAQLESMWIKAQVERVLVELEQYLQRARGVVTSDALGHAGEATGSAWNAVRGKWLSDPVPPGRLKQVPPFRCGRSSISLPGGSR